jgi:hypothetical protein
MPEELTPSAMSDLINVQRVVSVLLAVEMNTGGRHQQNMQRRVRIAAALMGRVVNVPSF